MRANRSNHTLAFFILKYMMCSSDETGWDEVCFTEQPGDVAVDRTLVNLAGLTDLFRLPIAHDDHAVGYGHGVLNVVRNEQCGGFGFAK